MPELDFNGIISLTAENDRTINMTIGVWNGNASLAVFANRAAVVKIPLNRAALVSLQEGLEKTLAGKPSEKEVWNFTKWDQETKKSSQLGAVYLGRDDKALLYIGISAPNHPPMKFPLRLPMSFDKGTPMTDVERSESATWTVIRQLAHDIPTACMLSRFKRVDVHGGGGGGNTGGGNSDSSIF